jgi:hypothetical protein
MAKIGDCLNIQIDKRDVPHARGLLGIVFNVGEGGGAEVVTSGGVISNGGNKFFLPVDRYKVIRNDSVEAVVPKELPTLRASILAGHFQARLMKTTFIAAAYKTEYGGTPLSIGGCGCKTNRQRYCGCRRKNVPCGDGCRCRGNWLTFGIQSSHSPKTK